MTRDKEFYSKRGQLAHLAAMKPNQSIVSKVRPLAYKSKGSTYGADGIRVSGSPEFIDAVMSRLKDLIDCENDLTRLAISRSVVESPTINGKKKEFHDGGEVLYIQVAERGHESMGTGQREATERYLDQRPADKKQIEDARKQWKAFLGVSA